MAIKRNVHDAKTLTPEEDSSLCSTLTDEQEAVIREVISRVTDKWSLWALSELAREGPLRFSRLMDRVEGVSQKSLTATLRHLERDGLINRTVVVQVPIRVDYDATDLGRAMVAQVHPLWMWVAVNLQSVAKARRMFDRRARMAATRQNQLVAALPTIPGG
jgi:DNA-binding HxlR family transcriptional regulator